jgi:membrane associated rhomboid family serine protease
MLEGYIHKIKYEFNRGDSMLRKLLLINIGAFVVFYSLRTIMHLSNASEVYELYIQKNLLFTVNLDGLLFKPWSLISYMFMHVGFGHIFFNMLLFFWMGSNFQDYLGNKRLLYVYIMGGVFAALVLLGAVYLIPVLNPMIGSPLIGASASIYAVTCAFATLLPNYEYSLFGMFNVRLKWIAWTLVFISFTEISNSNPGGNITHIGGALFGYL